MKDIFNNLAFKSTIMVSTYHKNAFLAFQSDPKNKKVFVCQRNLVSLKVEFVLQSAPFSVPHTFSPFFTVVVPLARQYNFLAVPFLDFSEYLIKLIFSFEVLES